MNLIKKLIKNRELLIITFILVSSFLVRWYKINSMPYGIEGDEFSWTIISYFTQFKIPSDQMGIWSMLVSLAKNYPVSIFINKIGFLLFGADILSPRKILIVFSVISMVSFYLLNRKFFSRFISLIVTLLYSFSAYKLIVSRIAIPPSYNDIFLYSSLLFLVLALSTTKKIKYLLSVLSGSFIVLGLFTYNIAYVTPLISITYIFFQFFLKKTSWKEIILILFFFLLPIVFYLPQIVSTFNLESQRKGYALGHVAFDYKNKQFRTLILKENILTVNDQLFKGLTYETSDMLVSYKKTLLPKLIVVLALIGLFLSVIKLKKYFLIFSYFTLSILSLFLFGIFLPRMWVMTIGSLFMLAGITLTFLENWFMDKRWSFYLLLAIITVTVISSDLMIFYSEAVNNISYLKKVRELTEIVKEHKPELPKKIIYVSDQNFNNGVIYPTAVFYYLSLNSKNVSLIKNTNINYFNILTPEEFNNYQNNQKVHNKVIIDNTILTEFESNIKNTINIVNKGSYFSEYILSK